MAGGVAVGASVGVSVESVLCFSILVLFYPAEFAAVVLVVAVATAVMLLLMVAAIGALDYCKGTDMLRVVSFCAGLAQMGEQMEGVPNVITPVLFCFKSKALTKLDKCGRDFR